MEENDINFLVQQYQNTNRLIRIRAVSLGVLVILIIGLFQLYQSREDKSVKLHHTVNVLQQLRDTSDMQAFIKTHDVALTNELYWEIGLEKMYYELERSEYKDKMPILERIDMIETKRREMKLGLDDYNINILGATVPVAYWLYFSPVIILLLYHDLTLLLLFRRSVRKQMDEANIPMWKKGPELFGNDGTTASTGISNFINSISNLLMGVLVTLPLLPALIGLGFYISYGSTNGYNFLLFAGVSLSPLILLAEILIIYYNENIFSIRDLIQEYVRNEPDSKYIVFKWFSLPVIIMLLHICTEVTFNDKDTSIPFVYFLTVLIMSSIIPIVLLVRQHYPQMPFYQGWLFVGVVMLLYWLVDLIFLWCELFLYSHIDPREMVEASFIFLSISFPLAFLFEQVLKKRYAIKQPN